MNYRLIAFSIVIGVASNFVSAALLSFDQNNVPIAVVASSLAGILAIFLGLMLSRLYILRKLGIRTWEASVSSGTSTADCVKRSQRSVDFLGIASSKWNRQGEAFRKMLMRQAGNGGAARFLLLNPYGNTCRSFEAIKNVPPGSISKLILENATALVAFTHAGLPLEIKFYDETPRFRIVILDGTLMLLGIYSYVTESGEDTPQLILDGIPRTWSFFFAHASYFEHAWKNALPAAEVLQSGQGLRT